jgi:hypothetical protein
MGGIGTVDASERELDGRVRREGICVLRLGSVGRRNGLWAIGFCLTEQYAACI